MSARADGTTVADVIVLGMGPGGEEVAGKLADAGLSVIGIEAGLVGGECPYWGCIPSKMMVRAAGLLAETRRVPERSGTSTVVAAWTPVAQRIREEATDDWDDTVAVERFVDKGGSLVRGRGRLLGPDAVEVDGHRFTARRAVVVATGSTPSIPSIDGLDDTPYWTNRDAIAARDLPGSMIVLGGGAIGAELGQVYSRFGVDVTIVEARDRLLPGEEPEVGSILSDVFASEGIDVVVGSATTSIGHDGEFTLSLDDGGPLRSERLLVATGRRVDLAAFDSEAIGVEHELEALPVDEHLRVCDGVWAVGDVTGHGAFTHVATYQARIAIADILGEPHTPADYAATPRVTFTDPEVGSVGLTESDARDAGIDVVTGQAAVPSTARGWIHEVGNEGLIKLVVDRARGVVVGATSMGPTGGEVLGMLTLAVHARTPIEELRSMIYAYPTIHRGVEDALREI